MGERLMPSLRPGTVRHKAIKLLANSNGMTLKDVYASLRVSGDIHLSSFKIQVETLLRYGVLAQSGDSLTLTLEGHDELNTLNKLEKRKEQNLVKARLLSHTGENTYKGEELKRVCYRPGAYDAFDKPSLINRVDQRTELKTRKQDV